jgi:hypothetical protein
VLIHYKDKLADVGYGKNWRLLWQQYNTQEHTVRQNAEFVIAAAGGTRSYHRALNGQPGKQLFQKYEVWITQHGVL